MPYYKFKLDAYENGKINTTHIILYLPIEVLLDWNICFSNI